MLIVVFLCVWISDVIYGKKSDIPNYTKDNVENILLCLFYYVLTGS